MSTPVPRCWEPSNNFLLFSDYRAHSKVQLCCLIVHLVMCHCLHSTTQCSEDRDLVCPGPRLAQWCCVAC